jgi:hypothetical protein
MARYRIKLNPKTGEPYIDSCTSEPYAEREYSDTLLCLLLKKHFPEYRERERRGDISTTVQTFVVLSPEKQQELQRWRREA